MTFRRLSFLVLLAGLFAAPPLQAQPAAAPPAPTYAPSSSFGPTVAEARAHVLQAMAEEGFPGLAIAVSVERQTVWSEGFGYADLEHRVPVWPSTKFRIASISKPLTAAAVAQLVAAGQLDVDAPVQRYVPRFPEKAHPVTTRQVGGHLGGIRHYKGDEFMIRDAYPTVDSALTIFAADPLIHEPGSAYRYSSHGWNLISAVVEGASGQDFLNAMQELVFDPLGMTGTVADHVDSLIAQRAAPYVRTGDGRLMNAPFVNNSYKWAGGGFLSTTEDLLRFANAHLGDDYLTADAKTLLFTEQQTNAGEGVGYGFGWNVGETPNGHTVWAHSGGAMGGSTLLLMQPDTRVATVVLINESGADLDVARDVFDLFIQAVVEAP